MIEDDVFSAFKGIGIGGLLGGILIWAPILTWWFYGQ